MTRSWYWLECDCVCECVWCVVCSGCDGGIRNSHGHDLVGCEGSSRWSSCSSVLEPNEMRSKRVAGSGRRMTPAPGSGVLLICCDVRWAIRAPPFGGGWPYRDGNGTVVRRWSVGQADIPPPPPPPVGGWTMFPRHDDDDDASPCRLAVRGRDVGDCRRGRRVTGRQIYSDGGLSSRFRVRRPYDGLRDRSALAGSGLENYRPIAGFMHRCHDPVCAAFINRGQSNYSIRPSTEM